MKSQFHVKNNEEHACTIKCTYLKRDMTESRRTYTTGKLVQGKASHSNYGLHWGTVVAVIICVDPSLIFARQFHALALINGAGSLVVMDMTKQRQINLVQISNSMYMSAKKFKIPCLNLENPIENQIRKENGIH